MFALVCGGGGEEEGVRLLGGGGGGGAEDMGISLWMYGGLFLKHICMC